MLRFNGNTIEKIDLQEEFADARRRAIMAPIIVRVYGGRSFAGRHIDRDAVYGRYLRDKGFAQHDENGYLP